MWFFFAKLAGKSAVKVSESLATGGAKLMVYKVMAVSGKVVVVTVKVIGGVVVGCWLSQEFTSTLK